MLSELKRLQYIFYIFYISSELKYILNYDKAWNLISQFCSHFLLIKLPLTFANWINYAYAVKWISNIDPLHIEPTTLSTYTYRVYVWLAAYLFSVTQKWIPWIAFGETVSGLWYLLSAVWHQLQLQLSLCCSVWPRLPRCTCSLLALCLFANCLLVFHAPFCAANCTNCNFRHVHCTRHLHNTNRNCQFDCCPTNSDELP